MLDVVGVVDVVVAVDAVLWLVWWLRWLGAARYIPMRGQHLSLNVVTALTCSLYEYRRQW